MTNPQKNAVRIDQAIKQLASNVTDLQNQINAILAGGDNMCRVVTGTYTGDGTGNAADWSSYQEITGLGFTPKYVRIWGFQAGSDIIVWMDQFATNYAYMFWESVNDSYHVGGLYRRLRGNSDGFDVNDQGSDYPPNANGITYYYLALG